MELTADSLIMLTVVGAGVVLALGYYLRPRKSSPRAPAPVTPSATDRFLAPEQRERQALINWLLSRAFEQTGVKVADDPMARQRVVEAAQKAVEELRSQTSVKVSLPFLTADASGPKHFEVHLTRDTFNGLAS